MVSRSGLVPEVVLSPLCLSEEPISRKELSRAKDRVPGPHPSLGHLGSSWSGAVGQIRLPPWHGKAVAGGQNDFCGWTWLLYSMTRWKRSWEWKDSLCQTPQPNPVHSPSALNTQSKVLSHTGQTGRGIPGTACSPLLPGSRHKPLAPTWPWEAACFYLCLQ